jgi:2-methylcitrate dehydratase PrpD
VSLHDRALTLAQFEPTRYDDPKLRRFAEQQVEISLDPTLSGVQAAVAIEMNDGATLTARCDHPRGSFENPLSRGEIEHKFRIYAKDRLPPARIDDTLEAVNRLEQLASVRELMDLLRQDAPRSKGERAA